MNRFSVHLDFSFDPFADVTDEEDDIRRSAVMGEILRSIADGLSGGASGGTMPLTFDQVETLGRDGTLRDGEGPYWVAWVIELHADPGYVPCAVHGSHRVGTPAADGYCNEVTR